MLEYFGRLLRKIRNERLYRRVPVQVPVKLKPEGKDAELNLVIANWSPGGVFIETPEPPPLFSKVELEFTFGANGGFSVRLKGQVVRHRFNGDGRSVTGMGIMFTDFSESGLLNVLHKFFLSTS